VARQLSRCHSDDASSRKLLTFDSMTTYDQQESTTTIELKFLCFCRLLVRRQQRGRHIVCLTSKTIKIRKLIHL
jgi:hypothetical protein